MISKGYNNMTAPGAVKGYNGPAEPPATISLSTKDLPAIKTWKVGQTYQLLVNAKLVSQRQDSYDKGVMSGTFEVQDVQEDEGDEGSAGEENG